MSRERVSARQLAVLREELTGREVAVLRQVAELKLMSTRQIEAVHFPAEAHASGVAAARACRRCLERLAGDRLLVRLTRRIGGVRAGSASFIYGIGPVGERLLNLPGPRRRFHEPSPTFAAHTLAVAQLVVELITASRRGGLELLSLQPEPACWRKVATPGGSNLLRPDLFVSVEAHGFEYRWFVEVDLGTEHLPTVLKKIRTYEVYYRSGVEQTEHGVFPRVLWLMHNNARAIRLSEAIASTSGFTPGLCTVTTRREALRVMAGLQEAA